ncbi:uncharacterized protein BJ212DRAFT_1385715 [Suillus subaureus]|uniref:Uncharacterized protein n=1 Tax=Suillus subaureus TaxID=48587 RepID=A0A9P7J8E5_9AGAM|nr:uncharacterized protein BJ212DRAFT_1385715 [Suillus subaureus]KAG1807836.1 hypothetical protein BJ212DRAFT_1385715 [Suillus subaureus]
MCCRASHKVTRHVLCDPSWTCAVENIRVRCGDIRQCTRKLKIASKRRTRGRKAASGQAAKEPGSQNIGEVVSQTRRKIRTSVRRALLRATHVLSRRRAILGGQRRARHDSVFGNDSV